MAIEPTIPSRASAPRDDEIVGREEELERLASFVAAGTRGPRALVVEGEPGIGKTTLWRHGVGLLEAAGVRVLRTAPAPAEASLPLVALTDLLEPVYPDVRSDLPPPQRRALDVALALEETSPLGPDDVRLRHAATLACLRALARVDRLAIAVDDSQWVDQESAAALSYALRRLDADPIVCLATRRPEVDATFDPTRLGLAVERFTLGPLSLGATQRVLLSELGVTYARPLIRKLVETSGGNPFYALELARAMERRDRLRRDEPPPLSQTLEALVDERLEAASQRARRLLDVLSLRPSATLSLLERLGVLDGLDEAAAAGLVRLEDAAVRFAHPLLGAGAYGRLGPEERRRIHAALASALEDPVERAAHLARCAAPPASEVADELAVAAATAGLRALPAVAAELAEEAARFTPAGERRTYRERRLLAARFLVQAGSHERAAAVLDEVLPELDAAAACADALRLRARVTSDVAAQRAFLERALDVTSDPAVTWEVYALLVRNHLYAGDLASALAAARAADEQARLTGDLLTIAAATTTRGLMEVWGTGAPDPAVYERARRLAAEGGELPADTYSNPHTLIGARALYRYELDVARDSYAVAAGAADQAGDVDSVETFLWGLAQLEVRAGRYAEARVYVERLRESGVPEDRRPMSLRWIEGVLATHEGRGHDARRALDETVARAEETGNWFFTVYGRAALGVLELALGHAPRAVAVLEPVLDSPFVLESDPGQTGVLVTAAEALVAAGMPQRAASVVSHLERRGHDLEHPWCLATAYRARGLLLGERRAFEDAYGAFQDALDLLGQVTAPLDRLCTLLALGSTQRRARQRREARATLAAAVEGFDELGAALWAAKARAELARIGGRAPGGRELTANERRVAELVSEGGTNREVAATLFVSERTVESALTQIYRKLDVRSRTELARALRERG